MRDVLSAPRSSALPPVRPSVRPSGDSPARRSSPQDGIAPRRRAPDVRRRARGSGERRRPDQPQRGRWRSWGRHLAAAIGGVILVAAAAYGMTWVLFGSALRVQAIHVNGAEVVDPAVVAAVSGLGGESLLWLDLEGAEARIESLAGVEDAHVARRWPQGVAIDIVEQRAWGFWEAGDTRIAIDAEGRALQAARPAPEGAPVIVDAGVDAGPATGDGGVEPDAESVRLVARLTAEQPLAPLGLRPSGFVFHPDRGLTVLVEDGPDIVFGDSNHYGFKLSALARVLRERTDEAAAAREIDLRFGSQVVLR